MSEPFDPIRAHQGTGGEFGWQDPRHQWEWKANMAHRPSAAHALVSKFGLYQCAHCGQFMVGPVKPEVGDTAVQPCEEKTDE